MTNYKAFGFGVLVVSILLLIILGHIYDIPIIYIPGWIGAMAVTAKIVYIINKRKQYTGNISGGACKDILDYNSTGDFDENWCNLNKSETDKTNLTKSANLKFHPNSNNSCFSDANKAYQAVNTKCENIIIKKESQKKSQSQQKEPSFWDDFWSSSNNYNESTEYRQPEPYYTNMSDYDLRQSGNVGNQSAYKEQADRRFRESPVNVRSDPDARPDTDFCTIM